MGPESSGQTRLPGPARGRRCKEMRKAAVVCLTLSAVAFLVGVVGNILELAGGSSTILWIPLTWWRGAMGMGLYALILVIMELRDSKST
jgi:hypothetical protein